MSHVHNVSDEMLYAYVDGELDAANAQQVEVALALDPQLAARADQQRQLRTLLRGRYDPVALEPVPERLLHPVPASDLKVADIGAARARASARHTARWAWREWGAMAATLLLGLITGLGYRGRGTDQPLITQGGTLVASTFLAEALTSQLTGNAAPGTRARIGFSIKAENGEYCRSFTVLPATSGLACRRGDAWVVDVLASGAPDAPQDDFRQAASPLPDAVRSVIEQRMHGEPLDAAEESAGINSHWQMAPVADAAP